MKITKRIRDWESLDREKVYAPAEAIELLRAHASKKFDETLEIAVRLGIDITKQDQNIRLMLPLPNGTGKKVRVAVITNDKTEDANKAGADVVGGEDLIDKIVGGFLDFDRIIATPDMMPKMSKAARILGPKGLMPNPKLGTVTNNVAEGVKLAKSGQIELRAEKKGIVHAGVGKISFTTDKLVENINTVIDALKKAKPAGAKGQYLLGAGISTTQGPGLKINV